MRESERLALEREAEQAKPPRSAGASPGPLSHGSINKTIRLLATILEQAVEYGYIDRNPAAGRKRLLRESKPSRSYLQPDQVQRCSERLASSTPRRWNGDVTTPDAASPCSRR